ncbi:MAG: hypothetical protein ACI4XE_05720 [Acutalibacteraceae bacterium]
MTDVKKILFELIGDEAVLDPDCELIESGLLDSLAMIELLDALIDEGVELQITRIDREMLKTPALIQKLADENS